MYSNPIEANMKYRAVSTLFNGCWMFLAAPSYGIPPEKNEQELYRLRSCLSCYGMVVTVKYSYHNSVYTGSYVLHVYRYTWPK